MKIVKILNNNAVIVSDKDEEKIAIGLGVGFQAKQNQTLQPEKIEKLFVLRENKKLQDLLQRIPEEFILLSEEIIAYAEQKLHTALADQLLLTLTDHLSFAIEREKLGIHVKNKLLQEIKILYKEEFEIGLWAIQHMKKKINIQMPVDEAAFIALHIHTSKMRGGDVGQTVKQTAIVKEMVDIISSFLHVLIEEESLSYERLITHLRFALIRAEQDQTTTLDQDMQNMIKTKFDLSFRCAEELGKKISTMHGIHFPEEELCYLTLHIERLRQF